MTDKELIRRALLGSREAQKECTRREIVLPCPKCGKGKIIFWDKKMKWYSCWDCGMKSGPKKSFGEALRDWNTRPAPPVIHAKWEWHGPCRDNKGTYWATCTDCGIRQRLGDYENYCPKCGARMDLEGDEQ